MKGLVIPSQNLVVVLMLLTIGLLQSPALSAQPKEKAENKKPNDKTIHIRIEKEVNGKKEVYEQTYDADDINRGNFTHSFPGLMEEELEEMMMDDDFLKGRGPHGRFFFNFPADSAQKRFFRFQQSDFDSLTKEQKELFKHFRMEFNEELAHSFPFDAPHPSLPLMPPDGLPFENPPFPPSPPFNHFEEYPFPERFEFDEKEYDIQEHKTDQGKKYLITPKKRHERREKRSENTSSSIQDLRISRGDNGLFNLRFYLPSKGNVLIRVTDTLGKEVLEEKLKDATGHYTHQLNLSKQPAGTYFVTVTQNKDGLVERIIIR
ncbi:MAG: T9SS type A sorting domain-containing protein [Bacteroidota bacterium]